MVSLYKDLWKNWEEAVNHDWKVIKEFFIKETDLYIERMTRRTSLRKWGERQGDCGSAKAHRAVQYMCAKKVKRSAGCLQGCMYHRNERHEEVKLGYVQLWILS